MTATPANAGKITVQELKGLNEREQNANNDLGNFDVVRGCVPVNKNTLTKANGCLLMQNFEEKVLSIHQTNDSRNNIIVQTVSSVRVISEDLFFNRTIVSNNLVPIPGNEEETMSRAIIVHSVAAAANGGSYSATGVWQQMPLNSILSQLNPDGTAAAFVTSLTTNQFTLAAGIYRIKGWGVLSNATANTRMSVRLYNVTAGSPAFNGALNEDGPSVISTSVAYNEKLFINGDLNLAGPTTFEFQGLMNRVQANTGFGSPGSIGGFVLAKELYRELEILKTA